LREAVNAQRIEIAGPEPYVVHVGRELLASAAASVSGRAAVLSDANVLPLHGARLGALAGAPRLALEPGEGSKTLATVERVLDFLAASDLDRRSTLVALGGGVVGDVAGLAASLYMRGIALVHCPTSLVAQVDASIGGKTGVNLAAGKNLAGTFHAPRAVLADVETLATLPERELRAGLGEVVKTALVGDPDLLAVLEDRAPAVLARDPAALTEVVARCVSVKAAIVSRDPREEGERKELNLGHTFAHAIELAAGFGRVPHGEAVAVGTLLALEASAAAGFLRDAELPRRVARLLERLGLPPSLDALRERHATALDPATLLTSMRHDKKGLAGAPAFVLVEQAGSLAIDRELPADVLTRILR
jgi:3-dehydroquinate synthase